MKNILPIITAFLFITAYAEAQVKWSAPMDSYPNKWMQAPEPPPYDGGRQYPYAHPYAMNRAQMPEQPPQPQPQQVQPQGWLGRFLPIQNQEPPRRGPFGPPIPGFSGNPFQHR